MMANHFMEMKNHQRLGQTEAGIAFLLTQQLDDVEQTPGSQHGRSMMAQNADDHD
jgi:hypothetical protein